jgi:thioredoxin 1
MRTFLFSSLLLGALAAQTTRASEVQPFVTAAFEQAKEERKTVLLHFFADWCPTCIEQKAQLDPLMAGDDGQLRRVVFMRVPYDDALALRKELKVNRQSTLIIFRGQTEVARDSGISERPALEKFLKKHIALE